MSTQTSMSAQTRSAAAELEAPATEPTREKGVREACVELKTALSDLHTALQELSTDMEYVLLPKGDATEGQCEEAKRDECGWARAIRDHSHQVSNATELVQDLRTRLDA